MANSLSDDLLYILILPFFIPIFVAMGIVYCIDKLGKSLGYK